jgi:hypothetical protein
MDIGDTLARWAIMKVCAAEHRAMDIGRDEFRSPIPGDGTRVYRPHGGRG